MAPTPKKPDIERITDRYLDAWESFGQERFSVDELEKELLRAKDPEDVPNSDAIYSDLYRVSALGLVDWFGEGKYQVAIPPEAEDEKWDELVKKQIRWVQSEVVDRLEERTEEPEKEEKELPDEPEIIEHDGQKFMSAFIGSKSDIESQARYYQAALSPEKHDGVVLRAYQDIADAAEKLSKDIIDDDVLSETVCVYRFDVNDQEMASVDDGLEYRIYLKETKLL